MPMAGSKARGEGLCPRRSLLKKVLHWDFQERNRADEEFVGASGKKGLTQAGSKPSVWADESAVVGGPVWEPMLRVDVREAAVCVWTSLPRGSSSSSADS